MTVRIGQGFDVHAFGPGDHVMLGGVKIPHSAGLVAHSDGDVALHALCDAMLGALALGDIGTHFPPTDDLWKDADSLQLLRAVAGLVKEEGYRLGNADLTLICEAPRLSAHTTAMKAAIANALDAGESQVSVKATTTEKLGFCGRGEGIAALASVLLESI